MGRLSFPQRIYNGRVSSPKENTIIFCSSNEKAVRKSPPPSVNTAVQIIPLQRKCNGEILPPLANAVESIPACEENTIGRFSPPKQNAMQSLSHAQELQ